MKMKELNLKDLMMDYDATRLNPSAMWDDKSIYLSIESGYAFTLDMNDEIP